jgi:hypothetical protein
MIPNRNKILIIFDEGTFRFVRRIAKHFSKHNNIYNWPISTTEYDFNDVIFDNYDIIIILLSSNLPEGDYSLQLLSFIGGYNLRHPNKLIISYFDNKDLDEQLTEHVTLLDSPIIIKNESGNKDFGKSIISAIDERIDDHFTQEFLEEKKALEMKEAIKTSSDQHLAPIKEELEKREAALENSAKWWFGFGYIFLVLGLAAPFVLYYFSDNLKLDIYPTLILYSVKSIVFVLLAISLSKYASTLGKAYMNESRKVADRRHAISFGEFALKVTTEPIPTSELKDIFKEWNINGNSSFMPGTTDDHDPKILEKVKDIVLAIKGKA